MIEMWCVVRIGEDETIKILATYYTKEDAFDEIAKYTNMDYRIIHMTGSSK